MSKQEDSNTSWFHFIEITCDPNAFKEYFLKIADTLSVNDKIDFITFHNYLTNFPLFLSEKIYIHLTSSLIAPLSKTKFSYFITTLYLGTLRQRQELYFNILNFTNQSVIFKQDLLVMINNMFYMFNYGDTKEIEKQAEDIWININELFEGKDKLTWRDFIYLNECISGNWLFTLDLLFFILKPFTLQELSLYEDKFYVKSYKKIEKRKNVLYSDNSIRSLVLFQTQTLSTSRVNESQVNLFQFQEEYEELQEWNNFENDFQKVKDWTFNETEIYSSLLKSKVKSEFTKLEESDFETQVTERVNDNHLNINIERFKLLIETISQQNSVTKTVYKSNCVTCEFYNITGDKITQSLFDNAKIYISNDVLFWYNHLDNYIVIPMKKILKIGFKIESIKEEEQVFYCYIINESHQYPMIYNFTFLNKNDCWSFYNKLVKSTKYTTIEDDYSLSISSGRAIECNIILINSNEDKKYIVKKIPKSYHKTYKELPNLHREVAINKLLKNITHPNIVKVHSIYNTWEFVYIVMEYIEISLLDRFFANKIFPTLSIDLKWNVLHQVANGISFLQNSFGIVHRDLKWNNVLYDNKTDRIKIIDFGFSTVMGFKEVDSQQLGTKYYIPPEMLKKEVYDYKVDVWCFGIIAYTFATGKFPFLPDKNMKIDCNKDVCLRTDSKCSMTNLLNGLVNKCLIKRADKRITIDDAIERFYIK